MKRNRTVLLGLMLMLGLMVNAAPRTLAQMKEAAAKAINGERKGKKMAPRKAAALKVLKATAEYQIIGNEQGGFAVIAADDLVPEVKRELQVVVGSCSGCRTVCCTEWCQDEYNQA